MATPRRGAAAYTESDDIWAKNMTDRFRQTLSTKRINELSKRSSQSLSNSSAPRDFASSHRTTHNQSHTTQAVPPPSYSSLRNIPLVPTLPADPRSVRFKNMLHSLSNMPVKWENPGLLDDALKVVPLETIYAEAQEDFEILQAEAESLGAGKKPAWGYQDCIIRALLRWFKKSFFSWVNTPHCSNCFSQTVAIGLAAPSPDEQARGANQVELYQCAVDHCRAHERFPRYNDAFMLLQTRKGRCGEWANCFSMLCRAIGARVRWIWNSEDHCWTEVYSIHRKRWIHVDACEGVWDKPRLYTEGWKKKLAYCIAFSADGAMDVTRRYVRNPSRYALDRTRVPEAVLLHILDDIRATRRKNMSKQDKFLLEGEDMHEDHELRHYIVSAIAADVSKICLDDSRRQASCGNGSAASRSLAGEQKILEGRQSGSQEWIRQRGESGQNTRDGLRRRGSPR